MHAKRGCFDRAHSRPHHGHKQRLQTGYLQNTTQPDWTASRYHPARPSAKATVLKAKKGFVTPRMDSPRKGPRRHAIRMRTERSEA